VLLSLARADGGIGAYRTSALAIIIVMSVMLVLWILARIMKKSRRWNST